MASTLETPDLLIAPASDQRCGTWIATKEVLANISSTFSLKGLVITISSAIHQINKRAFAIVGKEFIPLATPDDLDDIPASTTEN